MINICHIDGTATELGLSRLLTAMRKTFEYIAANGDIGLTKSKAFNRNFTLWAAEHFDWTEHSAQELLRYNKVMNEEDVLPVMVVHDLLIVMKLGRHYKGKFRLTVKGKALANNPGALFAELADTYLFQYNHARTSRFDFSAPGTWDVFLNIINVEAEGGVTCADLLKTFYGLEPSPDRFDREYHAHKGYLHSHVLRPLSWIGFLEETSLGEGLLSERLYTKSQLWRACLRLSTDEMAEAPVLH